MYIHTYTVLYACVVNIIFIMHIYACSKIIYLLKTALCIYSYITIFYQYFE